jgi:hypothetical protein
MCVPGSCPFRRVFVPPRRGRRDSRSKPGATTGNSDWRRGDPAAFSPIFAASPPGSDPRNSHAPSQEEAVKAIAALIEIGRILGGMIHKAEAFCGPSPTILKEDSAGYLAN